MLPVKKCYFVTKISQEAQVPGTYKVSSLSDERRSMREGVSCRLRRMTKSQKTPQTRQTATHTDTRVLQVRAGRERREDCKTKSGKRSPRRKVILEITLNWRYHIFPGERMTERLLLVVMRSDRSQSISGGRSVYLHTGQHPLS